MSNKSEYGLKVRLKVDLTNYHPSLVVGSEGETCGRGGLGSWSHAHDRFIMVRFPGCTLDVLWESLQIIDEEYLGKVKEQQQKFHNELKTAKNVKLVLGPKGGFRYLSLEYESEYGSMHSSYGFKEEANEIMEVLKTYGVWITTVKETQRP